MGAALLLAGLQPGLHHQAAPGFLPLHRRVGPRDGLILLGHHSISLVEVAEPPAVRGCALHRGEGSVGYQEDDRNPPSPTLRPVFTTSPAASGAWTVWFFSLMAEFALLDCGSGDRLALPALPRPARSAAPITRTAPRTRGRPDPGLHRPNATG